MFNFLSQTFMLYALILGLAIGVCSALLSPFLVFNRQAMISDGLSHVAFTGIIFGLIFSNQPIYFAIPFTILGSIIITYISQLKMIEHDSAIGVISSLSLAVGLIIVSLSDGFNRSIESLLVGSILTVNITDVVISVVLLIIVAIFIIYFYRKLVSITFDSVYAKFSKVRVNLLKYLLTALTAIVIVVGVRTVGMMLISAFIIFPALIASQLSKSFKQNIIYGIIIAILTIFISITISYHLDIPTGSTIVVCYFIVLIIAIFYRNTLNKQ